MLSQRTVTVDSRPYSLSSQYSISFKGSMQIETQCSWSNERRHRLTFLLFSAASGSPEGAVSAACIEGRGQGSRTGSSFACPLICCGSLIAGEGGLKSYCIGAARRRGKKNRHCRHLRWPRWNYCCQGRYLGVFPNSLGNYSLSILMKLFICLLVLYNLKVLMR
jgi:hypothetical protein